MTSSRFVKISERLTVLVFAGAVVSALSCSSSSDQNNGGGGMGGGTKCEVGDKTVCFKDGQAQGPMSGYGWVALGSSDVLSDPTCDTDKHAIDTAHPCTAKTNWN